MPTPARRSNGTAGRRRPATAKQRSAPPSCEPGEANSRAGPAALHIEGRAEERDRPEILAAVAQHRHVPPRRGERGDPTIGGVTRIEAMPPARPERAEARHPVVDAARRRHAVAAALPRMLRAE